MQTRLRYLEQMDLLDLTARVLAVEKADDRDVVILDDTVFYPQGGGQPYDQGRITGNGNSFRVDEVRWSDEVVRHFGRFESGSFAPEDTVTCHVDAERRLLHSRVHSAGHIVDMAVTAMELGWIPGKGYHFPDGPYVEYTGSLPVEVASLKSEIEQRCGAIVSAGIETFVRFVDADEMRRLCRFVPDNLPAGKPSRIVFYGDFGVPCGGTHVSRLSDVGTVTIRKIKELKGTVRVSYAVSQPLTANR